LKDDFYQFHKKSQIHFLDTNKINFARAVMGKLAVESSTGENLRSAIQEDNFEGNFNFYLSDIFKNLLIIIMKKVS